MIFLFDVQLINKYDDDDEDVGRKSKIANFLSRRLFNAPGEWLGCWTGDQQVAG